MIAGDKVAHKVHGFGTVLMEWGSWKACRTCYRPYCDKHRNNPLWYYEINGEGIFDVQFDGEKEIRSVNHRWLRPLATGSVTDRPRTVIPLLDRPGSLQ